MAVDHIRYDLLAQEALRGVVRHVLVDVAKNGLPGEHHFYISFDTGAEGVRISNRLRQQYPEEITVILQHQFWDLNVTDERFEVGLSFGGVPERLSVPFAAVKGFFDPSVQFVLQFETIEGEKDAAESASEAGTPAATPLQVKPETVKGEDAAQAPQQPPEGPSGGKPSGEVVRLDRFRKK
jgi:hypothetical protein